MLRPSNRRALFRGVCPMKVPVSWLKDYVDITLPIGELAERLTLAGLEVEHVEYYGVPGSDLEWDREMFVCRLIFYFIHRIRIRPQRFKLRNKRGVAPHQV